MKFGVARFDSMGNSQAPRTVKRAMDGLHVFYLYAPLFTTFYNFDAEAPSCNMYLYDEESIIHACNADMHLCKL